MHLLFSLAIYYLPTLKALLFSFPQCIISEGNHIFYFGEKKKNHILISHPFLCFWRVSQPEKLSNRLKQCMARKHHMLFSTFSIANRKFICSKNAFQYGMESHGPAPVSTYLNCLSVPLLLFFSLHVKCRVPAMAFACTTGTEGSCN